MGSCLTIVFAISFTTLLKYMVYGIFALGVVIFVHELGHFLVAKMCGVRCDKFYVGFDPPMPFGLPSALFKFTVGETEYGIGAIPLGGYVKMLGQNDNPAAAAQEAERIRIVREQSDDGTIESEGELTIDPRSYPAKPVWQRLMIISAGVVMNLIFAVIFGAAAYRYGMLYTPCVVGHTSAGMSGWQVGLQPGDKILQVGRDGKKSEHLRFTNDLAVQVKMRDVNSTVELLVRRYGASEPERIEVKLTSPNPEYSDFPFIGIAPSGGFVLEEVPDRNHSSLSVAASELKKGDKIVGVDGHEIRDYATFSRLMATRFDDAIKFTVERKNDDNVELVDVSVAPTPMRWVGLGMKMGPIAAIQKGSPAEIAGFKKGDVIESINGERVTNGIVVPYLLDRLAGQTVEFTVSRADSEIEISAGLRTPTLYRTEPPTLSGYYAAESLGIAFPVTNEIAFVEPGSPAEDAGCKVGDRVNHVQSMPKKGTPKPKIYVFSKEIDLQEHPDAWAIAHEKMQYESPNTPMKLTLIDADSDEEKIVELETVASTEWNLHSRGLFMLSENAIHQETDLKKAFGLGLRETKEGLEHVVAVLGKLVGGKISPKNLGGPFTIAASAGHEASQSPSRLLAFLTMLSANVAVLNFLPIPVLDGGHAMFLIYEAIFRKPLDERLAMGLTMVGFVFIVGLMIMVLGLDIHRMGTWLFQ